ncbi:MAG: hypothetical protein A2Y20_08145 [Firmicutes bacterium GWF2_51_9]|nr:MAG: hypothetical protein A2Y20_08145 [Firmicutes bacterium GWF2_51_9]OGS58678.1 MAG: hypothetical protein A2Y19_03875 [Firmicutes bacterium GWE2_51_13]
MFQYFNHRDFLFHRSLFFLAIFGLTHGSAEWLIMFNRLNLYPDYQSTLSILILLLYGSSFYFLDFFALHLFTEFRFHQRNIKWLIRFVFFTWIVVVVIILFQSNLKIMDILDGLILFTRYLTALPSGILTTIALIVYQGQLRKAKIVSIANALSLLAVIFLLYTLSTGLIGEYFDFFPARFLNREAFIQSTNIPIEVFRILFAIGISAIMFVVNLFYDRLKFKQERFIIQKQISINERRRMGSQLHDVVLQQLFVAKLNLDQLDENIEDRQSLQSVRENLQSSMQQIRDFLKSPVIRRVDMDDLRQEIEMLLFEEALPNLKVNFEFDVPLILSRPIDSQSMNNIIYIIREFLINSKKYAHASRIEISCIGNHEGLLLRLKDNGPGFNLNEVDSNSHFGINVIRNRVELCQGRIKWDTHNKTQCDLFIPWKGISYDANLTS